MSIPGSFARRTEIYMFPTPFSAELYGPDDSLGGKRLPAADRVEYVVLPATLEPAQDAIWQREQAAFTLVAENDWWRLFRRTSMM